MDTSRNASRKDAVVLVTTETDLDCLPIVAVLCPNGKSQYDCELISSNHLLSMYGKDDFPSFLDAAVREDRILFYDKELTEDLESQAQLQLLRGLEGLPSNKIIHQSRAVVRSIGLEPDELPLRSLAELAEEKSSEERSGAPTEMNGRAQARHGNVRGDPRSEGMPWT